MAPDLRKDDGGQMMLLAAVVLIFAFLALSAMVSRVSQLGSVTTQEQDSPILLEVAPLQRAIDDMLADLEDLAFATEAEYLDALDGMLEHVTFLESSRGFRFEATTTMPACDPLTGNPVEVKVTYTLSDGGIQATLIGVGSYDCPDPPPPPP